MLYGPYVGVTGIYESSIYVPNVILKRPVVSEMRVLQNVLGSCIFGTPCIHLNRTYLNPNRDLKAF